MPLHRHLITALALAALPIPAISAPPPNVDPNSPIAKWVDGLETLPILHRGDMHETSVYRESCCGCDSDCRPTHMRFTADENVQVWIDQATYGPSAPDAWVDVPAGVLQDTKSDGPPPDTNVWACWYDSKVRCFVPGWGG